MYLWITVMHKKVSHPNEIQNTKRKSLDLFGIADSTGIKLSRTIRSVHLNHFSCPIRQRWFSDVLCW